MSAAQSGQPPLSTHPVPTVGDLLWPSPLAGTRSLLERPDLSLTYNARGALLEVGQELMADAQGRDEVLVPAFHCPSGITPLIEAGLKPVYYRIRPDLSIDFEDLLTKAGPRTRAVVAIHFFGFEADLTPLQSLRSRGTALVEDWSHSFLQAAPLGLPRPQGDYQVFSFWKLVPSGVGGGILRLAAHHQTAWRRQAPPWREGAVRFKRELEEAFAYAPRSIAGTAFRMAENLRLALRGQASSMTVQATEKPSLRGEDHYPFDRTLAAAAMPGSARRRLFAANLAEVAGKRREHYNAYARALPWSDRLRVLKQDLAPTTCPWVFPVLLADRDRIDRQWRAAGVPLHTFGIWLHSSLDQTADRATRDDAALLSRELLCLSIHQGLENHHIEHATQVITHHLNPDRRHDT